MGRTVVAGQNYIHKTAIRTLLRNNATTHILIQRPSNVIIVIRIHPRNSAAGLQICLGMQRIRLMLRQRPLYFQNHGVVLVAFPIGAMHGSMVRRHGQFQVFRLHLFIRNTSLFIRWILQ